MVFTRSYDAVTLFNDADEITTSFVAGRETSAPSSFSKAVVVLISLSAGTFVKRHVSEVRSGVNNNGSAAFLAPLIRTSPFSGGLFLITSLSTDVFTVIEVRGTDAHAASLLQRRF